MRKRTLPILALAVSAATICAVLFRDEPGVTDDVRQLRDATIPPGARLIESSPDHGGTWTFESSWTLETSLEWDDYCRWAAARLPSGFKAGPPATQPVYIRSLPGDTQRITFENLTAASRLRVRVTFVSDAD